MNRRWKERLSRQLVPNVGTLVLVALMLFGYQVWAAPASISQAAPTGIPGIIPYQGTLTDASGEPINGNVDMTFRLYAEPTDGTALWTEEHKGDNAVPVKGGLFHVFLGSVTPFSSEVWTADIAYLSVQVGSDPEMSPREVVGAVPMALTVPDGAIGSRQMNPTIFQATVNSEFEVPAGTSGDDNLVALELTVDFPVDATYLIFTTLKSRHDADGFRVHGRLLYENGSDIGGWVDNSHPHTGTAGTQTGTIIVVQDFGAGTHTLKFIVANDSSSKDAYVRKGTQIVAIPLAQGP
jgi:hypothetical protein